MDDPEATDEYAALLEESKSQTYEDFEALDVLYVSGHDPVGRPIVVFIANRLPAKTVDLDKFLLFCIFKLDGVVSNDYVLVYVGADTSSANRPPVAWLRRAYALFSRNYKKHIQKLYLIHPSKFTRICLRVFKPFISDKFWRKLVTVDEVKHVHTFISPDQLRLPESCYNVSLRKGQQFLLFGTTLERAFEACPHPSGLPAPFVSIFRHLMLAEYLIVEGLFRVSGSETVMKSLRQDMEADSVVEWSSLDIHAATGVLKQFIRDLRTTVIPPSIFAALSDAVNQEKNTDFSREVAILFDQLPEAHRGFVRHFFRLLTAVTAQSEVNKMSPQNLAVCLAPHLLRPETSTPGSALRDVATQTNITKRLIECWSMIVEMQPGLDASTDELRE